MVFFSAMMESLHSRSSVPVEAISPLMSRYVPDDQHTQHTVYILTILSLTFASVSVVSTLSTLYWFVKMRRSFRHEQVPPFRLGLQRFGSMWTNWRVSRLILLLIQSDFVKSAAFVVFPLVSLYRGNIESDSAFCQFSGFALAIGVESSDVAILLIALHSIMYIFRPKSGLYPYRHMAYLVFYLFPVSTACLAFINGNGFENVGHYCYLRTDNGWSRLALSWIPRYLICASIVGIYAFIYFYIRKRMDDYGRRSSTSLPNPQGLGGGEATDRPHHEHRRQLSPPIVTLPRISYHGLIPSTPSSKRTSTSDTINLVKTRQLSTSTVSTVRVEDTRNTESSFTAGSPSRSSASHPRRSIQWNWGGFSQATSSPDVSTEDTHDPLSTVDPGLTSPPPAMLASYPVTSPAPIMHQQHSSRRATVLSEPSIPGETFFNQPLHSSHPNLPSSLDSGGHSPCSTDGTKTTANSKRMLSLPNIFTMLRRGPSDRSSAADTLMSGATQATAQTNTAGNYPVGATYLNASTLAFEPAGGSDVSKNREKIRRQLRSLFVYPLVYMIIWTFPFVSHVMGYDDSVKKNDPQWLLILGILSLSVQGMVDCMLFAVREQPWRHARGRKVTEVVKKRLGYYFGWPGSNKKNGGTTTAGRTREEVLVDGRLARERREGEIVSEREANNRWNRTRRGGREWWDVDSEGADIDSEDDLDEGEERTIKSTPMRAQHTQAGATAGTARQTRSHSAGV
ncbi:G protein-coupled glucose receptor regulating Gpa2-domain-containing protein [Triangularia verruculosa]|uniref:G protein-coupled glucose receptor regulating Gpa2-domain-containing protein n=1 Tax=Triangularia verruculosa TaxID=2587418 RepID=A0AAN7AU39_9PEZI|nr:G protein-coupled glucose receptor regulating Gpa2-domain-containing protein [Triangularia verruculosa]